MPKNRSLFQDNWLGEDRFKDWVRKKDDSTAKCSYCWKDISIGNMREAALTSHVKSKKHLERAPSGKIINSMIATSSKNPSEEPEKNNQKTVDSMLTNVSAIEAEIRWVLSLVCSRHSMNSSNESGKLFQSMFPDSSIAQSFQMWQHKG